MAYCCHECKRIFERNLINCPSCGGTVSNDCHSADELRSSGYREKGSAVSSVSDINSTANKASEKKARVEIDNSDILRKIRNEYESQVGGTSADDLREDYTDTSHTGGFFDNPDDDTYRTHIADEVKIPSYDTIPDYSYTPDYHDSKTTWRPHRLHRHLRFRIPWRLIGVAIIVVVIIVAAVSIWNARFVILSGLFSLLGTILPYALIIIGIIMLLRGLFGK